MRNLSRSVLRLPFRGWTARDWAYAGLVAAGLLSLPAGLSEGGWLVSSDVLWWAALLGGLWGLLLARLARRSPVAVLWIFLAGIIFNGQYFSRALPPVQPATHELASLSRWSAGRVLGQVEASLYPAQAASEPAPAPDLVEWQAALERLRLYGWNLRAEWPPDLHSGRVDAGQTLMGSLIGLVVFLVSGWAVWTLARKRPVWLAVLPVLVVLLASSYFRAAGWGGLIMAFLAGLILTADESLRQHESLWSVDALPYGIVWEWWTWSGAIGLMVALSMMGTITLTDPSFGDWLDERFKTPQESASSGPSATESSEEASAGAAARGIWPREHLLGGGIDLADHHVMSVRTPGLSPGNFYWRASIYDTYTGLGWERNISRQPDGDHSLWPDSLLPPPGMLLLRQSIRLENPTTAVYAAGQPVGISQAVEGYWLETAGGDLVMLAGISPQAAYEVLSWVPAASPEALRQAGEDYPAWVVDGYLGLPDGLPESVRTLSDDITAGAASPYDRAVRIQVYLRQIPYTLDLPEPPTSGDIVEYFLFDLQRGYCDYYATSMVVMARSIGIPARLAVGYATGTYNSDTDEYAVSAAEAHSWPEIYFPGAGWIPFEPTASRPEIALALDDGWQQWDPQDSTDTLASYEAATSLRVVFGWKWLWLVAVPPVFVGLAAGAALLHWWRWLNGVRQSEPREAVRRLYGALVGHARRLGVHPSSTQTPLEFEELLSAVVRQQAAPRWGADWPRRRDAALRQIGHITRLYSDSQYSKHDPDAEALQWAIKGWASLNRLLWACWLACRAERIGGKASLLLSDAPDQYLP